LLILLLAGVWMLAEIQLQAEKVKPGANDLMTTQNKADLEKQMMAAEERLTNAVATLEQRQASTSSTSEGMWYLGAVFLVIATIAFLKFMPRFNFFLDMRTKAKVVSATANADATAFLAAEEQSVADFAARFRVGPNRANTVRSESMPSVPAYTPSHTPTAAFETKPVPQPDPLKEFLTTAAKRLEKLSDLVEVAEKAQEEAAKVTVMTEFSRELDLLKTAAELPAVLPAWQMATALEGLLKQLVEKPKNITESTLRTVSGAVDVLRMVSVAGLPEDLLAEPPIRLLAVDDDPLSRHAVAFALKKALSQPDMAANGQAALALATQIGYDAVFLDVQMPGMNGFELCGKIHETDSNTTTPVVFVTCHSDGSARELSKAVGGQDLIAKPFLIFEITVKALTLVMRRRVEKKRPAKAAPAKEAAPALAAV